MPRFVLLEHDHPILHWDLMLETGAVLLTWRLSAPLAAGVAIAAERIGDHRPIYLSYEGPVSGGRGSVTRWDGGEFDWLEDTADRKVVRLRACRSCGTCRLERKVEHQWWVYLEPSC
jgi:hypothetical protein